MLRFNNAPTKGYEKDVGSKTTIRILNSQVVTKPQFQFLSSPLYKRLKLLMWDPSNYTSSVNEVSLHTSSRTAILSIILKSLLLDRLYDVPPFVRHSGSRTPNTTSRRTTCRSERPIRGRTFTSFIRSTCGAYGTTYKITPQLISDAILRRPGF